MKFLLMILLFAWFGLVGCSSDKEPGIEGYIVKKEAGRILVVAQEAKDFSSTGGLKEFYNAIWFTNAPRKVEAGQKVQVWFDVVLESYPGQAKAKKVLIMQDNKPDKAKLSEFEVIRKALTSPEIHAYEVPAIKSVQFNPDYNTWQVTVRQGEDDSIISVLDTP